VQRETCYPGDPDVNLGVGFVATVRFGGDLLAERVLPGVCALPDVSVPFDYLICSRKQHPPLRAYWSVVGSYLQLGSEDAHGHP
jgi:hypothetical protein